MKLLIKNIPNILTSIRILLTPFILYFTIKQDIKTAVILIIIASITDFFDGLIARNFNLISKFGATLDTISDKLFAGCLIIALIFKNSLFLLSFVGEIIISIINIYAFAFKKNPATKYIGKIKTTILFITISLGYISIINKDFTIYTNILIIISFILQLFSILTYFNHAINYRKVTP